MKRISFNPRFVNEAGDDLVPGKIHTLRQNFEFWKKYEGKDVALFTWEGKPYQKGSKHKVFCVKRLVSVQEVEFDKALCVSTVWFSINGKKIDSIKLYENDGFYRFGEFVTWFRNYKPGKMAILHFTDFWY